MSIGLDATSLASSSRGLDENRCSSDGGHMRAETMGRRLSLYLYLYLCLRMNCLFVRRSETCLNSYLSNVPASVLHSDGKRARVCVVCSGRILDTHTQLRY